MLHLCWAGVTQGSEYSWQTGWIEKLAWTMQHCGCLQGQYHKVHVGAACPTDRLASLASLLGPTVISSADCMLSPLQSPPHHWHQVKPASKAKPPAGMHFPEVCGCDTCCRVA